MIDSALLWLFLNILSIVCLAFYSMLEMACVSFNKVRLHYYVSKKSHRAIWLNDLLHHPFRLFGTTLIGVNVAMIAGSECAREFHRSIGLSPDLAPLSQVILVVVFGELAPMFAARHYAEHVAMMGAPLLYASSRLLSPAIWLIGIVSSFANWLVKGKIEKRDLFLSQEELQKILEEQGDEPVSSDSQDFNVIAENIFHLRHKEARHVMSPLHHFARLPSNANVAQMRNLIKKTEADFILIYLSDFTNIVGIAFPRDLVKAQETRRIRDGARPPWFVTENTKLIQILQQFQRNNQTVAVILDQQGKSKGIITLDTVLDAIIGESKPHAPREKSLFILERTFPGEMTVEDFDRQFKIQLDKDETLTLSDLLKKKLGHTPEPGESVYIEPLELIAKETSLLEVKTVLIKTR